MFLLYISIVIGIFSIFNIWGGYVLFEHILLAVGGIYSLINYKNSNTGLPNKKSKIIFCLIFIILFIYNLYHSHLIITLILQIMTPFFFLIIIKYNKSLDYLGKNSLLLYLYHIPIIMILNYYIVNKNELVYTIMYLIINFLIIVFWNIIKKSNKNKMIIYSLAKNKTDS